MARKMTDAQKAENAKKRAAKKGEEAKVKAEAEAKTKADADEESTAVVGDEGKAAGDGDGRAAGAAPVSDPDPAAAPEPEPEADQGPMASIKTKRGVKSRWRAGRQFGPEPVEIPLADLDEDQLEALEADPSLVV